MCIFVRISLTFASQFCVSVKGKIVLLGIIPTVRITRTSVKLTRPPNRDDDLHGLVRSVIWVCGCPSCWPSSLPSCIRLYEQTCWLFRSYGLIERTWPSPRLIVQWITEIETLVKVLFPQIHMEELACAERFITFNNKTIKIN